ncbi:MAG: hypothetical protein N3D71_02850 [Burkholderiaceae bacterium]|nr:hypothetical protein [Burkholderiaceae bacterium]
MSTLEADGPPVPRDAARALTALERSKDAFGGRFAASKLRWLQLLAHAALRSARQVERLHELLCFLRAYPDDARVLARVEAMLARFARRADLRSNRAALAHTGIAGTDTGYPFFYPTAEWLARRWPALLRLDRSDAAAADNIARALPLLVTAVEAAALKELALPGYAALDRVRGRTSDAVFLIERIAVLPGDSFTREAFYDGINPSCTLASGDDTPARTREKLDGAHIAWQTGPLRRARPDLRREIARAPRALRRLPARKGREAIDLARGAMVARQRDLDAFAYGDARDVWLVDDGDGYAFVVNGVEPQRRAPLAAIYGGLVLRNGVPIGYLQADLFGRSAALSFNTFETFRGGESAYVFARMLAMLHHAFGATSFTVEPYQLGQDNDEGIASGAWWFYFKLGFRPRAADARRIAREELARIRRDPRHRSSEATLRALARRHLFFEVDPARPLPLPPAPQIGLAAARLLDRIGGADREAAVRECARVAVRRCGGSLRGASADERRAWERCAPVVLLLPGIERWHVDERRALVDVFRAKGGRSEREFVSRLVAHARLHDALFALRRVTAG